MPYWDEHPYKIVTHNPLSSDITSIMYTPGDVQGRLDKGDDPVELSIDKWQRVLKVYDSISLLKHPYAYYKEIINYIGYKTCALCLVSIKEYENLHGAQRNKEDKCCVCPFSEIDRCIDNASNYSQIELILNHRFNFGDDLEKQDFFSQEHIRLRQYIENFIELLKKIR